MKKHYATLLGMAFMGALFIAASAGVAEDQNKDRTGAPGSDNACSQCHSAGEFNPEAIVTVLSSPSNEPVDAYVAGETYNVAFTVVSFEPVQPSAYGFQATAVFADGSNAGTFQNPGPTSQLEDVGGRHIIEHNQAASLGVFIGEWVAPASGSGDVTFYMSGVAANGTGSTAGDGYAGSTLTLSEATVNIDEVDRSEMLISANGGILDVTVQEQGLMTVFNLGGQLVDQFELVPGQQQVQNDLSSGVYIFKWVGSTGTAEQKIAL